MTKASIEAMIAQFGSRIYVILMDNGSYLYIGYRGGVQITDVSVTTIGGQDFLAVKRTVKSGGKDLKVTNYHEVGTVQWIGVMDEADAEYRVDPMMLR